MPIEGFEELEAALRELGDAKAIKRTIKAALLEAAEPTAKMARSLAPRKTGDLAEGVDVSTTLSRRQKSGRGGHVRARGRFDPFAAFVYIGAHPMGPGAMPAKPFMRPAWEANKMQILRDFQKYLWVTIEMEAKRIARRQARLLAKGPKK
jgi:HK97 gp10 family phage protein